MSLHIPQNHVHWVDVNGNPITLSGEMTANAHVNNLIPRVESGESIGSVNDLYFRDPNYFCAGQLHHHV